MAEQFIDVDHYVSSLPPAAAVAVAELRRRIHAAVPGLGEAIRYNIPTFTQDGTSVVHIAGWKHHVSVYPTPDTSEDQALASAIEPYSSGQGTLKFSLKEPLPYDLVDDVVRSLAATRGRS